MTQQFEREIKTYDGKVFGFKVSGYGKENGYLDYRTLSQIVGDMVLNNAIVPYIGHYEWELVNGCEEDEDGWYEVTSIISSAIPAIVSWRSILTRLYIITKNLICTFGVLLTSGQAGIMY